MTPTTMEDLPEAPFAGVLTDSVSTAGWRSFRAVIDLKACTRCALCWKFCPDVAVALDADGWPSVSLDHCKGCGICAQVCKPHAIEMVKEDQ